MISWKYVISVSVFLLGASLQPPAAVARPNDGHEFIVEYFDFSGVSRVRAKLGKIVFWYEHSGRAEAMLPAPVFFQVDDSDGISLAEGLSVICDGQNVFVQKEVSPYIPVEVVATIVRAKQTTLILKTINGERRENLTGEDIANLNKLVSHGSDWKPPANILQMHGEATYVVIAGPNTFRRWEIIRGALRDAVASRTDESDQTLFIFVDERLYLRPPVSHFF